MYVFNSTFKLQIIALGSFHVYNSKDTSNLAQYCVHKGVTTYVPSFQGQSLSKQTFCQYSRFHQ